MRKCLLFIAVLICHTALAAPTPVVCDLCRDVYEHPEDFANHAYNQVFGDNPALSFADGDLLEVVSRNGQWAIVDLKFILQPTGLSLNIIILSYSVSLPNGKIEMVVQDPRGGISRYEAFTQSPDLIVGDGTTPTTASTEQVEQQKVEPPPQKASSHNGSLEVICCQPGAYYWSIEQIGFGMQLGSE